MVYGRLGAHADSALSAAQIALIRSVQGETHVRYSETHYTNDAPVNAADRDSYRVRAPFEARTYDITGIVPSAPDGYFTLAELRNYRFSVDLQPATPPVPGVPYKQVADIDYHALPSGAAEKRLLEHERKLFFRDDLQGPLPLGQQELLGLGYEGYKLALTDGLLNTVFGTKVDQTVDGVDTARGTLANQGVSGYVRGGDLVTRFSPRVSAAQLAGQYWVGSGTAGFANDAAQHFYLPERYTDVFGKITTVRFDTYDLFIERSTDPLGNTTTIEAFDFRVLAPRETKDINDNLTEVVFDVLGLVVATAVKGKGAEADNLLGFTDALANPSPRAIVAFCASTTLNVSTARTWLRGATTRFVYHFGETRAANEDVVAWSTRPGGACTIRREIHAAAPGGSTSPLQVTLECSDGSGNVMMKKMQAEPRQAGGPLRWIVSGKTVVNNKAKAVKRYEPYFSDDFGCEPVDEVGVTPLMYYDAAGRRVRTEFPDGTLARVAVSPWQIANYDAIDTVRDTGNAWYARNSAAAASGEQRRAATLAAAHRNTPAVTVLDSLGREVIGIAHHRYEDAAGTVHNQRHFTFTKLDAEGKPLWIRDARGNLVMQHIRPPMPDGQARDATSGYAPAYDLIGNMLFQHSMDAADRWMLPDAAGEPMVMWDFNERREDSGAVMAENRVFFTGYDALHRRSKQWLTVNGAAPQLIEQLTYGESVAGPKARNLRGQLYQQLRFERPLAARAPRLQRQHARSQASVDEGLQSADRRLADVSGSTTRKRDVRPPHRIRRAQPRDTDLQLARRHRQPRDRVRAALQRARRPRTTGGHRPRNEDCDRVSPGCGVSETRGDQRDRLQRQGTGRAHTLRQWHRHSARVQARRRSD